MHYPPHNIRRGFKERSQVFHQSFHVDFLLDRTVKPIKPSGIIIAGEYLKTRRFNPDFMADESRRLQHLLQPKSRFTSLPAHCIRIEHEKNADIAFHSAMFEKEQPIRFASFRKAGHQGLKIDIVQEIASGCRPKFQDFYPFHRALSFPGAGSPPPMVIGLVCCGNRLVFLFRTLCPMVRWIRQRRLLILPVSCHIYII